MLENVETMVNEQHALGDTRGIVLGYVKEFIERDGEFAVFLEKKKIK